MCSSIEGWSEKLAEADRRRVEIEAKLEELKPPPGRRPNARMIEEQEKLYAELRLLPNPYDIDMRFTFTSEEIKWGNAVLRVVSHLVSDL